MVSALDSGASGLSLRPDGQGALLPLVRDNTFLSMPSSVTGYWKFDAWGNPHITFKQE